MHYGEAPPSDDPNAPLHLWQHWRTDMPEPIPPAEELPIIANAKAIIGISVVALITYLLFFSEPAQVQNGTQAQWKDAFDGVRR